MISEEIVRDIIRKEIVRSHILKETSSTQQCLESTTEEDWDRGSCDDVMGKTWCAGPGARLDREACGTGSTGRRSTVAAGGDDDEQIKEFQGLIGLTGELSGVWDTATQQRWETFIDYRFSGLNVPTNERDKVKESWSTGAAVANKLFEKEFSSDMTGMIEFVNYLTSGEAATMRATWRALPGGGFSVGGISSSGGGGGTEDIMVTPNHIIRILSGALRGVNMTGAKEIADLISASTRGSGIFTVTKGRIFADIKVEDKRDLRWTSSEARVKKVIAKKMKRGNLVKFRLLDKETG